MKKFFNKLKSDYKFKKAGPGQKLGEESQAPRQTGRQPVQQPRQHGLSAAQAQAAAAALERIERGNKKTQPTSAVERRARQELQNEKNAKSEADLIQSLQAPESVNLESAPVLSVQGVYYECPISSEIVPKVDYYNHLEAQLNSLKADSPLETAILKINCLNKNKEMREGAITILKKYLDNISKNPTEEKFRKIKKANKAFTSKVASQKGTIDFLEAIGWIETDLDGEEYYIYAGDDSAINGAIQALSEENDVPRPTLFRNPKHLTPTEGLQRINLPTDFFKLSTDEIKAMAKDANLQSQHNQMLMTSAMRENAAMKEKRQYSYCLIRIRFPDSSFLEGTFNVYEKSRELVEFVRSHLNENISWVPFQIRTADKLVLSAETEDLLEKTLTELKLVPAATVNFHLSEDIQSQISGPILSKIENPVA